MISALVVYASTFTAVFFLGLQSLNVNQGHYKAAAFTSLGISAGHMFLYEAMPHPSLADRLGYVAGGVTGILFSMWFHRVFKAWWPGFLRRLRAPKKLIRANTQVTPPMPWPPPPATPTRPTDTH